MNMDLVFKIAQVASYVIAGVVVALNGIAPMTATDKDDKLRDALRWVEDKLTSLILPLQK